MYTAVSQGQLVMDACCPTALKSVTHSTAFGGYMIGSLASIGKAVVLLRSCKHLRTLLSLLRNLKQPLGDALLELHSAIIKKQQKVFRSSALCRGNLEGARDTMRLFVRDT